MVTDEQVKLFRRKRKMEDKTQEAAAVAAGMSVRTARDWEDGPLPSEREKKRHWRTRADPFAQVWPRIRAWLDVEPDRTAKELLERLHREYPGQFSDGSLRTLQRRVQAWRTDAARRMVLSHHDRSVARQGDTGKISS